jgi:hypothetical protein
MVHNELRKIGVFVSGSDVRSNKRHHDLDNFKKYLTTLVTKVTVDDLILNNAKVVALEETAHTSLSGFPRHPLCRQFQGSWPY